MFSFQMGMVCAQKGAKLKFFLPWVGYRNMPPLAPLTDRMVPGTVSFRPPGQELRCVKILFWYDQRFSGNLRKTAKDAKWWWYHSKGLLGIHKCDTFKPKGIIYANYLVGIHKCELLGIHKCELLGMTQMRIIKPKGMTQCELLGIVWCNT